jgi:hypothetical protein
LQLNVFSRYTYTLETIIQAGMKGIPITWVPIRTNEDLRPSRLVKGIGDYVRRSVFTILRIFLLYRPLRSFFWVGTAFITPGLFLLVRWLVLAFYALLVPPKVLMYPDGAVVVVIPTSVKVLRS